METCRATTLILLDVLPLCVSETVVTCLVCVCSVNTQTFSDFYSTNRHFIGEQTMRSAPRLREQFPPSGHSFIYFHSFIVFASLSYFSLFCSFFVYLWLFCGPLWFSLDNWLEETNTRCLVFATYNTHVLKKERFTPKSHLHILPLGCSVVYPTQLCLTCLALPNWLSLTTVKVNGACICRRAQRIHLKNMWLLENIHKAVSSLRQKLN